MSTKAGKGGGVPRLRFPEFREAGEWEEKQVGEVFKVTRGEVLSMTLVHDEKTNEARYPVYSSQTKNNGLSGYYSDFLYEDAITWTTDGANAGDVNYRSGKFYCTNVCGVLINADGYANPCIAALINSVSRSYVSYVGNPKLMNGVMARITIPFPTVEEQQRIAHCLVSLDELITLEAQKLAALKVHKKGLMQQLFPAEGETLPRLRFPEFRDAGEWSAKQLKQICAVNPANSELPEIFAYIDLESVEAGILKAKKIISREESPSRAQRLLDYGDVIFQIVRPYQRNNFYFRILDDIKYVASTGYAQLRAFESKDFLFQVIHTDEFVEKAIAKCTGSSYPAINSSDLAEISVAVPKPAEQQKIADCLASLDNLITAQTQQLAALKTHKKGLMQQIFPVLDEVSA